MNMMYRHAPNTRSDQDDPTHEYVDCVLTNNNQRPDFRPIIINFQQNKTANIVDKANEYYLSVVRWSLHSSLPVIIPEMNINQAAFQQDDLFLFNTEYWLNIGWGLTPYEPLSFAQAINNGRNVLFVPEDQTIPQPVFRPTSTLDLYNQPYYYIKSIQHFLDMVNVTISSGLLALKAGSDNPAISPEAKTIIDSTAFPKFVWNANSGKIEFLCSLEWMYESDFDFNDPTKLKLFLTMNPKLMNLFDTFPHVTKSYRNTNDIAVQSTLAEGFGTENTVYFSYNYGVNSHEESIDGGVSKEIYINSQQASSVPSWSPVGSITFNTFQIPVHNSLISSPDFAGDQLDTTLSQNTLSNVLTDFTLPLVRGDEYSNQMTYFIPTSEYRLFDLVSDSYLKSLNIAVKWIDTYGNLHPLYLKYGTSASIKLMFRKKDFNKN
jgi:hypothetical protein